MPTGDRTITKLNCLFSPENIDINAPLHVGKFEQGKGLQISFVFDDDPETKELLEGYVETIPAGIAEAFRATVYQALKGVPRTPIVFTYEPAYDFELRVTQTPNTLKTPGIITIALRGRYISDPHPLERAMRKARQAPPVGADRKSSKSRAKGERGKRSASRPARRKASKRS